MSQYYRSVSTIIATYNRPKLLARTLDCLARQTLLPAEVLVVDDGSDLDTRDALSKWRERVRPEFELVYMRQKNQGPAVARNNGMDASRGELIHFLDDDDLLCTAALERLAGALAATETAIATASYQHWEQGNPKGEVYQPLELSTREVLSAMIQGTWFVPIHGYLFTRRAIDLIGPWNPILTSQEDDEFLLRAALAGIAFLPAPDARVYYCQHAGARRATPGKPGETVSQGIKKRMYADLAIRESVFETLAEKGELDRFHIAFSVWHARLRKRYLSCLVQHNRESRLLNWLNDKVTKGHSNHTLPAPMGAAGQSN